MAVMRRMIWALVGATGAVGLLLAWALFQVAQPMPSPCESCDVFGIAGLDEADGPESHLPELQLYRARDGALLSYRFYDSTAATVLVFIHGSSYHGAAYHALAQAVSSGGHAKVYLPNLRGHYMSGPRRGDVDYIGQLEDDVADLIGHMRSQGHEGLLALGGHSSGGGLAVRFAGGAHRDDVDAFVLLSPFLPLAPTVRQGGDDDWARLNEPRLYGLLILNAFGVHALNGLPIIQFNKPRSLWDGTETLTYSYRLNTSYHPRYDYQSDIAAMGDRVIVLVGGDDEANEPSSFAPLFAAAGSSAKVAVLPGVGHLGIYSEASALERIGSWFDDLRGVDL